jgi:hypothetical protein
MFIFPATSNARPLGQSPTSVQGGWVASPVEEGDHRTQILLTQVCEDLARHHDQRTTIATHTTSDGADVVHVSVIRADTTLSARQVWTGDCSDGGTAGVHGAAKIRTVAERAVNDVADEVLTTGDGCSIGRYSNGVD